MSTDHFFKISKTQTSNNLLNQVGGFSMIEMLIAIAILSILAGIAVTGMQPVIQRSQSENTLNSLRTDLVFSRGEAIKRGGWVGFCGSEDRSNCSTSLQKGWLVFHDVDKDNVFNNTDTVLSWTDQEHASLSVELEEVGNLAGGPVMFNYRGYPDRSVVIRAHTGEINYSLALQKTGGFESQ